MNSYELKIIAVVTMILDHVGLFFFPQFGIFRVIGRLSFPLFCWFVAQGAKYTSNAKLYVSRMILFATISQIPFFLTHRIADPKFHSLNAIFTLSIGLGAILLMKKTENKIVRAMIILSAICLADVSFTDYGGFGVLSIISFYFFSSLPAMIISQVAIYGLLYNLSAIQYAVIHFVSPFNVLHMQTFALFSLVLIAFHNGKQGPKTKYFFYAFYPLQYVIFYILLMYMR
jgi:hypothetical protein